MAGNNSGNRQDNRQRGNAAQLLEKYKSMARDAQLSGDRVQTEYYLQFADHYFRMLGDARPRFDEQKRVRDDDDQDDDSDDRMDSDSDNDGDNEFDGDGDDQSQQQPQQQPRRARPTNDRAEPRRDRPASDRGNERSEPRRDRPNGRVRDDGNTDRGREPPRDDNEERIDFAVLPPAIGIDSDDRDSIQPTNVEAEQEAPRPRRRVRRPVADEGDASTS